MIREIGASPNEAQRGARCGSAYMLVTAAHNEEAFIEKTIKAVMSQTLLPKRWVIVSDGSIDETDKIVGGYADRYPLIELVRIGKDHARSFASKVYALNAGLERLNDSDCEFIGNLDADVSFDESYFANLVGEFERDPGLGLAGGFIYEKRHGGFSARANNSIRSVAGAVQLFRRECYESVGGILPLKYGGEDWCAEVMARMKGWRVRAIPELKVFHHKPTGAGAGVLRYWYHQGFMDYSLGSHPLFAIVKCLRRLRAKPYVAGTLARLTGFVWAYYRKEERPVPREFVEYLRREQKGRLFGPFQMPF
jgi:glycosyltransferase involved in cell wall biosynthesis